MRHSILNSMRALWRAIRSAGRAFIDNGALMARIQHRVFP